MSIAGPPPVSAGSLAGEIVARYGFYQDVQPSVIDDGPRWEATRLFLHKQMREAAAREGYVLGDTIDDTGRVPMWWSPTWGEEGGYVGAHCFETPPEGPPELIGVRMVADIIKP